jgi:diketogulonate reductase-like aldo/keto reductase
MYGNEAEMARAVRDFIQSSSTPRSEIFVTTKWNPPQPLAEPGVSTDQVYRDLQASKKIFLEDYGLEYVDLMLVHQSRPGPVGRANHWKALVRAKADGWIKEIGVSNQWVSPSFPQSPAEETSNEKHLADLPAPVPAVNQIEVHPWLQQRPITEYCNKHDIRVIAFCPLVRAHPDRVNDPVVVRLGEKYGKTWAQIIIRWSLQKGYVLTGVKS